MKELNLETLPKPLGAYSNGLVIPIGDKELIFLSGMQAIGDDGKALYPDDPGKQTEFIFNRINNLLNEAGASLENAVKVVIYLTNMSDFGLVSPIRNQFLGKSRPVSTLVEVSKLTIPGCVIEIDITAVK